PPSPPEQPNADGDNKLDALAGHAGFVAGVIARASPRAAITVADHNGAFVAHDGSDTPIPPEASVARSLWKHRAADVLHVGFAFPTLPNALLPANAADMSGPPSWAFELVLQGIGAQSVLVAPAGNQGCSVRQYPAALRVDPGYPNVVGVGSIATPTTRSSFS